MQMIRNHGFYVIETQGSRKHEGEQPYTLSLVVTQSLA